VLGLIVGITSCSETDPLLALSKETGLPIIDVSVPFERFAEAPGRLEAIADAFNNRTPGLFVMRYYDDTTRNTLHVFAISRSHSRYVVLSSVAGDPLARQDKGADILGVEFDASINLLRIETDGGTVQLEVSDVTPVGA